jgi:hypothetical protein
LRRHPLRAQEIAASRQSKLRRLRRLVEERNAYLQVHPKAKIETAMKKVQSQTEKSRSMPGSRLTKQKKITPPV